MRGGFVKLVESTVSLQESYKDFQYMLDELEKANNLIYWSENSKAIALDSRKLRKVVDLVGEVEIHLNDEKDREAMKQKMKSDLEGFKAKISQELRDELSDENKDRANATFPVVAFSIQNSILSKVSMEEGKSEEERKAERREEILKMLNDNKMEVFTKETEEGEEVVFYSRKFTKKEDIKGLGLKYLGPKAYAEKMTA